MKNYCNKVENTGKKNSFTENFFIMQNLYEKFISLD